MSLPDGVTTCLLTYGPITDTFGNLADSISVEVVADRTIVHAASGRTLFKNPVVVTADGGGVAQLPVPFTDQAGFRDQQQNSLTGWYYTVRLSARFGNGIQTDVKTFQPLVGQTTVDADLLPSNGVVTPGVTAPTAVVTSVAGFTGEVTAEDLAGAVVPTTGWLKISSTVEGSSVEVRVCRTGDAVEIKVNPAYDGVLFDQSLGNLLPVLPEGFAGDSPPQVGVVLDDNPLFRGNIFVDADSLTAYTIAGDNLTQGWAHFTYKTDDDWPTTLPGTPVP